MSGSSPVAQLEQALESLSPVASVGAIAIEEGFIQSLSVVTDAAGTLQMQRLDVRDAPELYEFYSQGLSEKARRLFAPYPLFDTPPAAAGELAARIAAWKREDDWTALNLFKDGRIIGFGLLKRFRSEQATSAIVIGDAFQKRGLGLLLQTAIVEQARLLKLKGFHIKVISDNLASVRLHEKCGFRHTRILPPPLYEEILQYLKDLDRQAGAPPVERRVLEMVIDFHR
jgi:RimJ/RimL family protein N-acetyltransferase